MRENHDLDAAAMKAARIIARRILNDLAEDFAADGWGETDMIDELSGNAFELIVTAVNHYIPSDVTPRKYDEAIRELAELLPADENAC